MISNPNGLLVSDNDNLSHEISSMHQPGPNMGGQNSQNSHSNNHQNTSNHSLPHHHTLASQNFSGQPLLPHFIQTTTGTSRSDRSTPV